jgi:putative ABC transport system substrate-binding protein
MTEKVTLGTLLSALGFFGAMLFALCVVAEAQQTGKIVRIGYLDGGTVAGSAGLLEAFRQQLNKLDWIEGKNLTIDSRFANGKIEKLRELAAELVRVKVDAIVTAATSGAWAAKQATTSIPIIMASGDDPVNVWRFLKR